jgi:chromate transporter
VYDCFVKGWRAGAAFFVLAPLGVYIGVIAGYGMQLDKLLPMGMGIGNSLGNTYVSQFLIGLVAGLVTFGGAYTALPFVQYETVTAGRFISNQVFLDSIAVCSILPTPMVMFVTMVSGRRRDGVCGVGSVRRGTVAAGGVPPRGHVNSAGRR